MELAIHKKKMVQHWVRAYASKLDGMPTASHLNILPLGSYSMILGMELLYLHRTKIDFYEKTIECLNDNGELIVLQGKKKSTSVRMVITMQAKDSHRKGFIQFTIHISSDKVKEAEGADVLNKYPFLQQFHDVFPLDISEFPPQREVDFFIDLI